jgi:hypothetical protein
MGQSSEISGIAAFIELTHTERKKEVEYYDQDALQSGPQPAATYIECSEGHCFSIVF